MEWFRRKLHFTNIHTASRDGDLNRAKALLERGEDPNKKNLYGWTPLHIASEYGHLDIATLLVKKGARIDAIDYVGISSLYVASREGHLDIVRFLLQKGAPVNHCDRKGWTPLQAASVKGHLDVMKLLLQNGYLVNQADKDGWTPLLIATHLGHFHVVGLLLQNGALVNVANKYGSTPLIFASSKGELQVVRLLLNKGVDIHATDNAGHNALQLANYSAKKEIAHMFVEHEKLNAIEIETVPILKEGLNSPASESRSIQTVKSTKEQEQEITKLRSNVSNFNEEVNRLEAQLKSVQEVSEKSDMLKKEEIDRLKQERSELLSRLISTQNEEKNGAGPSGNNSANLRAEERDVSILLEKCLKQSQCISSLLDEKEKYQKEKETEVKEIREILGAVISERNAEIARLGAIIRELENKVQELTDCNEGLSVRNEQLVTSVRERDLEIERLSHLINQLKNEINVTKVFAPVQLVNINLAPNAGQANINIC